MLDWAKPNGVGFSAVVSLGVSADIDFPVDVLDFLATDHRTESIILYIEGIRNARRFMSALRAAARVKTRPGAQGRASTGSDARHPQAQR